jgi:hypothetical protein
MIAKRRLGRRTPKGDRMKSRAFVLAVVLFAAAAQSRASCGSASCPIDLNALNTPFLRHMSLDLSLQYIDQDQPRGHAEETHHTEVRTINRIATATLTYAATERLQLSASLPFVSRDHFHLETAESETFDLRGVADTTLLARYEIMPVDPERRSLFWLIGGVKLPTGKDDRRNADGEVAELAIQTGSGATDGIVGFSFQNAFERGTRIYYVVPYFITATYQFRGSSDLGRLGNELQINTGGALPFGRHLEGVLQLNTRIRGRDHTDEPEDTELSGGTWIYASPGLRFTMHGTSLYALAQLPVHQHVNGLQLTSKVNYVVGVQTRF